MNFWDIACLGYGKIKLMATTMIVYSLGLLPSDVLGNISKPQPLHRHHHAPAHDTV